LACVANSEEQALDERFPSKYPCGTTFAATGSTSAIGLFVGVVFFRWPRKSASASAEKLKADAEAVADYANLTDGTEDDPYSSLSSAE
jgi:hypothetical protein